MKKFIWEKQKNIQLPRRRVRLNFIRNPLTYIFFYLLSIILIYSHILSYIDKSVNMMYNNTIIDDIIMIWRI